VVVFTDVTTERVDALLATRSAGVTDPRGSADGRARLHGAVTGLSRAALVQRCARDRAGVVQLAADAPGDARPRSYGHPHPGQEEVYFVSRARDVRHDNETEAELLVVSTRLSDAPFETVDGVWLWTR
jgi:hypothetical protein